MSVMRCIPWDVGLLSEATRDTHRSHQNNLNVTSGYVAKYEKGNGDGK
jgi:hypothetical protein